MAGVDERLVGVVRVEWLVCGYRVGRLGGGWRVGLVVQLQQLRVGARLWSWRIWSV